MKITPRQHLASAVSIGRCTIYVNKSVAAVVAMLSPLSQRHFESSGSHVGCGQLAVAADRQDNNANPVCASAMRHQFIISYFD